MKRPLIRPQTLVSAGAERQGEGQPHSLPLLAGGGAEGAFLNVTNHRAAAENSNSVPQLSSCPPPPNAQSGKHFVGFAPIPKNCPQSRLKEKELPDDVTIAAHHREGKRPTGLLESESHRRLNCVRAAPGIQLQWLQADERISEEA